ncbi:MAG: hypothetical protein JWQ66_2393 [Mucilaginibacter sp.]|nr:hypothetical protein [Mucilaginibacter sp.]
MLSHLSWTNYFETVMLLLVIYYAFVGIRFYAADIRGLLRLSSKSGTPRQLPEQLVYREQERPVDILPEEVSYASGSYPDDDIRETDELIASVKSRIAEASGKAYAPDELIPQLKNIFKKHAGLNISPHRPAINELVVTECERTGTAGLTEEEVDQWWSD